MSITIMTFTGTEDSVAAAVAEAQAAANGWLDSQGSQPVRVQGFQTDTIVEANKATGGMIYTHVITLLVDRSDSRPAAS